VVCDRCLQPVDETTFNSNMQRLEVRCLYLRVTAAFPGRDTFSCQRSGHACSADWCMSSCFNVMRVLGIVPAMSSVMWYLDRNCLFSAKSTR
jgi:hypothetical protein